MLTAVQQESRAATTASVGPYVDVRGAAAYLGLSTSYLNKLRAAGLGPECYVFGRAVRYAPAALDAWARAHVRQTAAVPATETAPAA
jgi:hypothetical protein